MGRTYHNRRTGNDWHANIAATNFLAKIFFGVTEKIGGIPHSVEECKIFARILRNRVRLNQWWDPYWEELYDVEKEDKDSIEWMKEGAEFFESIKRIEDLEIL